MKKITISLLISLLIVLIGMLINYRAYQENRYLQYSIRHHGGEITIEHGFGLQAVHIYAMDPADHDSHKLRFSLFSFLLFFIVTAILVYLLLWIAAWILKRRS